MVRINPFVPGITIDPEYFAGRKQEIDIFTLYLEHASKSNPQNLAIMGERGIGKSSLLRKFEDIARSNDCIVIRREIDPSIRTVEDLVAFLLNSIRNECLSYFSIWRKAETRSKQFFEKYNISPSVTTPVGGGGIGISKFARGPMQDYLYDELMHIWKQLKGKVDCVVFLLDECEVLNQIPGVWAFIRTVFSRAYEHKTNYMLVISGKLGLFKGIKEMHSPLERFFYPLELKPLTLEETEDALVLPLKSQGVSITDDAIRQVFDYSVGHPYVVQVFGFHLFEKVKNVIDSKVVSAALPDVMARLKSQVFRDRYLAASCKEQYILNKMSTMSEESMRLNEIAKLVHMKNPGQLLERLVEKDCLRKPARGTYAFFHPLFKLYVKEQGKVKPF